MLTPNKLQNLEEKYGMFASWAVWNPDPTIKMDTQIIRENIQDLHKDVVMVGLNISNPLPQPWSNFHFGLHDRKLNYAFNQSPYRGAYMTDIVKGEVDANSSNIRNKIKSGEIDIAKHVNVFQTEMEDLGATRNTLFILFGHETYTHFKKYLGLTYPNFVMSKHYSYAYAPDVKIVDEIWNTLENHSIETHNEYGTLKFFRSDTMKQILERLGKKSNPKWGTVQGQ